MVLSEAFCLQISRSASCQKPGVFWQLKGLWGTPAFYFSWISVKWSIHMKGEGCRYICIPQPLNSVSLNWKCYCQIRRLFLCLLSLGENFRSVFMGGVCWYCMVLLEAENLNGSLCFLHRGSMFIISMPTLLTQHNWQPNSAHPSVPRMQN